MLKSLLWVSAAMAFTCAAAPVLAQSTLGPTPNEQVGMHIGTTVTNGSAVVVTDRTGTHPEGYPAMNIRNHIAGSSGVSSHRRHHHPGLSTEPTAAPTGPY